MRNKHGQLVSERGNVLVEQRVLDIPLVTVENYEKWYSLYIIQPSGDVEKVDVGLISELSDKSGKCLWIDHAYHPHLLLLIAEHIKGEVPATSLEMVAGRWVLERGLHDDIDYHLPSYYEN